MSRNPSPFRTAAGAAFCALALLLAACATTPRVEVAHDPEADFARYRTFGFQEPLRTDRAEGTRTVLSQVLRNLTRAELESRGYRYAESGADLLLDFSVDTREKVESYPDHRVGIDYRMHPYYHPHYRPRYYPHYHPRYSVWGGYDQVRIRQFTEGTLHVDVVDVARDQLVWEAVAQERLAGDDFVYAQDDVRAAITEIFARFPRRVAGDD